MGKAKRLKQRETLLHPEPQVRGRRDRRSLTIAILICTALILATLAVYWQVTHFQLLTFDDETYIFGNNFVKDGISLRHLHDAFRFNGYAGNWHPVTWLSLMLDSTIYGPATPTGTNMVHRLGPFQFEAEGYHLTNLVFHIINTVLLFVFARWITGSVWRGGFVAGLFALHPLHVESVAWVAERKDVLSTFFWLLTTLAYIWYAKPYGSTNAARGGSSSSLKYLLVLILFALGLMAKPMLVTLPLTLLLLDFWPLKRLPFLAAPWTASGKVAAKKYKRRATPGSPFVQWLPVLEKIPLLAMSLAACVVTYIAQSRGGAVTAPGGLTLPMRAATACLACVNYLFKMVWPYHLAAMYPYPVRQDPLTGVIYTIPPLIVVVAALILVTLTTAAILLRRRAPYVAFGWFWYLVTLIPVLGFVQVGYQRWADRYTYVPLIGIFVILACGIPEIASRLPERARRTCLTTAAVAVLCLFGCLTRAQAAWWHDSKKLYYHTLDITKDNWFMRNALGRALLLEDNRILNAEGTDANAYRITLEAVDHLKKGLEIDQGIADIHNNLGVAYRALSLFPNLGETPAQCLQRAIDEFEKALRMDPSQREAALNLGTTLKDLGRPDDAIAAYEKARQARPDDPEICYQLALAHQAAGQDELAMSDYETLLRMPNINIATSYWGRVNLSKILLKYGRRDEAAALVKQAADIEAKTGIDSGNETGETAAPAP